MMDETVAFRLSAAKARRLAALCGAAALLCLAGLAFTTEATPAWVVLSGWAAAAGLSAVGLVQALRTLDRRPALLLDTWGVTDRRMRVAASWSDIETVRPWGGAPLWSARWLALEVRDPADAHETLRGQVRMFHRLADAVGAPSVLIDVDGLEASPRDVLAAMQRFKPALGSEAAEGAP